MPTMTITTTASQAQRAATACGALLALGRDATSEEIKSFVISQMRGVVLNYEKKAAQDSAIANIPPLTPFDPT